MWVSIVKQQFLKLLGEFFVWLMILIILVEKAPYESFRQKLQLKALLKVLN